MFVTYEIDVEAAKSTIDSAPLMSLDANERLAELTEKLQELTEDVRLTADDLIPLLTVHAHCCSAVCDQAMAYVNEDGDLPKFGG